MVEYVCSKSMLINDLRSCMEKNIESSSVSFPSDVTDSESIFLYSMENILNQLHNIYGGN